MNRTAGDWEFGGAFEPGKYPLQKVRSIYVAGAVVAHVNCAWEEAEANARLIAQAPALLEALMELVAAVDDDIFTDAKECTGKLETVSDAIIHARAVMKKAVAS